jgi:DNA-binding HxlR family transcriptional regulator
LPAVARLKETASAGDGARPAAKIVDAAITEGFAEFARESKLFSRKIAELAGGLLIGDPAEGADRNLQIVRTIFSKWNLEMLALLYGLRALGFEEIRRHLKGISAPVLSRKLKFLHRHGLIERTVISTPVLRVQYALTPRGLVVAQLGEPVLLYLRLTDGIYEVSEKFVRQPAGAR